MSHIVYRDLLNSDRYDLLQQGGSMAERLRTQTLSQKVPSASLPPAGYAVVFGILDSLPVWWILFQSFKITFTEVESHHVNYWVNDVYPHKNLRVKNKQETTKSLGFPRSLKILESTWISRKDSRPEKFLKILESVNCCITRILTGFFKFK